MNAHSRYRVTVTMLLAAAVAAALTGCLRNPDDRAYITDARYREARRAFERSRSTEVARMAMEQAHWPRPMINEAIYRIEKEFGLKDELPSPVRVRSEAELLLEEQSESAQTQEFTHFSQLATQGLDTALQLDK